MLSSHSISSPISNSCSTDFNRLSSGVDELSSKGMSSYCITLDKKADDYIQDIFGNQYTVIDHVDRLPEKLPKLFMSLTR